MQFNQIPTNLRVPFVTAEFDSSKAQQGAAQLPYRCLLIGQKIGTGSAPVNTLVRVTTADAAIPFVGRGSMLHRMAIAFFAGNQSTECWMLVLGDSSAAAQAAGSLAVTGPATASGTVAIYVGGQRVPVAVTSGDSASTIATNIAAALGEHASGTVTLATAVAGTNVGVGATTFIGTTGAVTPGAATYSVDTSDSTAAGSLASQVTAHPVAGQLVRAVHGSGGLVNITALASGPTGNSIALTTTDTGKAAISAATLTGGSAVESTLAAYASVSGSVVGLHAMNAGAAANELDVRVNYADGETMPAGVGITVTPMAGGTSNPTLTAGIAEMGDNWYHVIANPYTDSTSLTALENELADRAGPMRMIDGCMLAAKNDSYSNVAALGESRNSGRSVILRTNNSPTASDEYAAHVAGIAALSAQNDPAQPFQTLALPYILAPALTDRDTLQERNLLLYDGIATTRVNSGGDVEIERLVTTYQRNAAGSPDTAYLDLNTPLTLMFLRYQFRVQVADKYPRAKVADDGQRFTAGQSIVSPSVMKGEAIAWFQNMQDLGLVEGLDQFKADLVVQRNESDPNRIDILLPPDLINQLVVVAAQIQFLL